IGDNYMETQTSGGQINIDEDGGDTLIRGNRIQLSTTGGNDIGVSLRADTGASRCIIQGNTFAGTGAALPIKEVAATANTEVLENHYDFSFTVPVTLVGTSILLRDVIGLVYTQATLPNVAAGSIVGCSDCTQQW